MDFSVVTDLVTAKVTAAMGAAAPLAGLVLATIVGWRIYKHFAK